MGMDLEGAGGYFRFTMSSWSRVGELAVMGGWQPTEGTCPPSDWNKHQDGEWDGSYGSNDGARVSDEDAQRMADALERVLPEVPDQSTLQHESSGLSLGFAVGDRVRCSWRSSQEGTVKGCRTPILPGWPKVVVVRWDEFGESFDQNCNDNPKRDHVPPKSLIHTGSTPSRGISLDVAKRATAFDWFSGSEMKSYLREFIAYCRNGGFAIH